MLLDVHGAPVYCYTGGKVFDALLPAIVLLHGAQNDHSVWTPQGRTLAEHGYAVLAPDLPGHGLSGGAALTSVEAMAGWVLALLATAGVGRAMLVGHSMGALVALEAAHRAPQRVAGLALLGATYPMSVSAALLATALEDERAAIELIAAWSHRDYLPGPSAAGPGVSAMNVSRRLMQRIGERAPPGLLHTDFMACDVYANGAAAAARLDCPVLFVQGRHDQMTPPRGAQGLTGAVRQARIASVDTGHAMMMEAPGEVGDLLLEFAATVLNAAAR